MSAFLLPLTMTRGFLATAEKQPIRSLSDLFLFTIGVFSVFSLLMKGEKISSEAAAELILLSHTFRSLCLCLGLAASSLPPFIFRYAKVLVIRNVTSKAQASKQPGQCAPWGLWCIISPAQFPQPVVPQDASSTVKGNPILPHSSPSFCSCFSSLALFQFADLFVIVPQISTVLLNLNTVLYLFLCQFRICIMGILNLRLKIYEDIEKQIAERCAYLVNPYLPLHISHLNWF